MVVEGEWLEVLDEKGSTGLTRVQTILQHNFNIHNRYVVLEDCEALNVALLLVDPTDITCNVFEVVTSTRPRVREHEGFCICIDIVMIVCLHRVCGVDLHRLCEGDILASSL